MLPRRRRPAPQPPSSGSSLLAPTPEAPLRCYCCRQLVSRSTPATGCRSRSAAVWVLARRTRCGSGSRSSRGRGGGCGTRCRGEAGGDIDSLAIAPTRVAYAVETKTRAYDDHHLARVREQAAWMSRRRRRWCRRGAVPVVCVVRACGVQRLEKNVLVVSIDQLIPVLRSAVGELGMRGSFDQRDPLEMSRLRRQPHH